MQIKNAVTEFPTGGKVRDPRKRLNWCDSNTDSKVWMREEVKG